MCIRRSGDVCEAVHRRNPLSLLLSFGFALSKIQSSRPFFFVAGRHVASVIPTRFIRVNGRIRPLRIVANVYFVENFVGNQEQIIARPKRKTPL